MRKLFLLCFVFIFLFTGCIKQGVVKEDGFTNEEKDYTSVFAKSGLNIDSDSNDMVDEQFGGTNSGTLEEGLDLVFSSIGLLRKTGANTYSVATEGTDYASASHGSTHGYGGTDIIGRLFEGVTAAQATLNGTAFTVTSKSLYFTAGLGDITVDDFSDASGDHSDYNTGDYFGLIMNDLTVKIDFSDNSNIEGNVNTDFTGDPSQVVLLIFMYYSGTWHCINYNSGFSDPTTVKINTFEIPYSDSGDVALTEGRFHQKSYEDALAFHGGDTGKVKGEGLFSLLQHVSAAFDPAAICDLDQRRVFLFTVGDDMPHGIKLVEWKLSFEANPGAQFTASQVHLKSADDFFISGGATELDDLATSVGVASEDTTFVEDEVENGDVVYLQFDSDYSEIGHLVIFEMWFYPEEDDP